MDTCLFLIRFGRKPMLLVSHVLGMGFGLCSAFSSSFIMFAVLRFFTGFTITGSVIISTILSENPSLFKLFCLYNYCGSKIANNKVSKIKIPVSL